MSFPAKENGSSPPPFSNIQVLTPPESSSQKPRSKNTLLRMVEEAGRHASSSANPEFQQQFNMDNHQPAPRVLPEMTEETSVSSPVNLAITGS